MEITPEQQVQIDAIRDKWVAEITKQYDYPQVVEYVNEMWKHVGVTEEPLVLLAESPNQAKQWGAALCDLDPRIIAKLKKEMKGTDGALPEKYIKKYVKNTPEFNKKIESQPVFVSSWWRCWSAVYHASKVLGVTYDEQKLSLYTEFSNRIGVWVSYNEMAVVSKNPVEVHFANGEMHNDSGPCIRWADGQSIWAITNITVDEQIVMRPETQTIEQIRAEQNEEVKRIRIERYGWSQFIKDYGGKVLDNGINDIDGTREALFELPDGQKSFAGVCRSTGRAYFLEVDPSVKTCREAQIYLRGGRDGNCIGAS
jgi:hypothetical protein